MFKSKKFKVLAAMAVVFMIVIAATPSTLKRQVWNALQYFKHGIMVGTTNQFQVDSSGNVDSSGGLDVSDGNFVVNGTTGNVTTAGGETPERKIDLNINDFSGVGGDIARRGNKSLELYNTHSPLLTASQFADPYFGFDSSSPAIVWKDDSVVTPELIVFRVPEDYLSGGGIRLFASETGAVADNSVGTYRAANASGVKVDYDVYVHTEGFRFQTADDVYDQTAMLVGGTPGRVEEVELTMTDGSDSLIDSTTDQWITLRIWRNAGESTNALWIHGGEFYYTPQY